MVCRGTTGMVAAGTRLERSCRCDSSGCAQETVCVTVAATAGRSAGSVLRRYLDEAAAMPTRC